MLIDKTTPEDNSKSASTKPTLYRRLSSLFHVESEKEISSLSTARLPSRVVLSELDDLKSVIILYYIFFNFSNLFVIVIFEFRELVKFVEEGIYGQKILIQITKLIILFVFCCS